MLEKAKRAYWTIESKLTELYISIKPITLVAKQHQIKQGLVVSLTSFPARFDKLHLTIKGLLMQSVRPDYLILWVGENEYKQLPQSILLLEKKFKWFQIRRCEDIKSYTKLIPTLSHFPNYYIVTADDDVYYPPKWLENLTSQISDKKIIICHRAHKVTFDNEKHCSYNNWRLNCNPTNGIIFATGIGGVLYPPQAFDSEVINQETFLDICASADDVWFFWMARMNKVPAVWSGYNFNVINWSGTDDTGLAQKNVGLKQNDICIEKMIDKYQSVFNEL